MIRDGILDFLHGKCEFSEDVEIKAKDLYQDYVKSTNHKLTYKSFRDAMQEIIDERTFRIALVKRRGCLIYVGLHSNLQSSS